MQIKSVKNIERSTEKFDFSSLTGKPKPNKYFDKIPAIIFALKSSTFENTINYIGEKVDDKTIGFEELPDIIFSLHRGIIFYSPFLQESGIGKFLMSEGITIPSRGFITYESKEKEKNLVGFLKFFLSFSLPTIQVSKFIVKEYLDEIETGKLSKIYGIE